MATQQELDDLDDLDDILDDFGPTEPLYASSSATDAPGAAAAAAAAAAASTSAQHLQPPPAHGPPPPPNSRVAGAAADVPDALLDDVDFADDDFVRQLQQGMEHLMREMETSPQARTEFESLVKSMSDATADASTSGSGGKPSFNDAISRTMERIQESETQAERAREEDVSQSETDAFLADMLKQLDSVGGGGGGDGMGSEAGMAKMLEGMMEQLMSKDILYEPMKDLQEKYPPWLESNKSKLTDAEYQTYSTQCSCVKKIMAKFDDPKYDDEDKKAKTELVDLMQKMQELGPLPKAIMSELAPGMELDADGLPNAPGMEQCRIM